jgi:hypothetical protein
MLEKNEKFRIRIRMSVVWIQSVTDPLLVPNQWFLCRYYKSYFDCVSKIVKTEGPLALYKGLLAQYFR